jgi:sugar-specific transcriptional regulator TrmB
MLNIDTKVETFLYALGLSETETALYLYGLTKSGSTVSELVDATNINRTTAYHALGTLKQKGFVTEAKEQGKLIYEMTKPDELEAYLDRRHAEIDSQRHKLKEISSFFPSSIDEQTTKTVVEKFEGLETVKEAIDRALYCKSREWRIIAPKDNFFSQTDAEYAKYFMSTRRERKIKSRSLWEPGFKEQELTLRDFLERSPRYLPNDLAGHFNSIAIIYDDKALFISSAKNPSAVIIGSQELVGTLIVMHDALWSLARKPSTS